MTTNFRTRPKTGTIWPAGPIFLPAKRFSKNPNSTNLAEKRKAKLAITLILASQADTAHMNRV